MESSALDLPGVKAPPIPRTPLPLATIPRILFRLDMKVVDVVDQVLQRVEELMALTRRDEEGSCNSDLTVYVRNVG